MHCIDVFPFLKIGKELAGDGIDLRLRNGRGFCRPRPFRPSKPALQLVTVSRLNPPNRPIKSGGLPLEPAVRQGETGSYRMPLFPVEVIEAGLKGPLWGDCPRCRPAGEPTFRASAASFPEADVGDYRKGVESRHLRLRHVPGISIAMNDVEIGVCQIVARFVGLAGGGRHARGSITT